jgi:hypothetical protein
VTSERRGPTRRRVLAAVAGGVGALAGCLGDGGDGNDDGGDGSDDGSEEPAEEVDEELVLEEGVVLNTAFPVRLFDPDSREVVADVHYHPEFSHWHRMPLSIPSGQWTRYRVRVVDRNDEQIPLGPDGVLTVEMEAADDTPRDIVDIEVDGADVDLYGRRPGVGDYVFALVNDGERVWEGSLLSVSVE